MGVGPVGDHVCKGGGAGAALKDVTVAWMALKGQWMLSRLQEEEWLSRCLWGKKTGHWV